MCRRPFCFTLVLSACALPLVVLFACGVGRSTQAGEATLPVGSQPEAIRWEHFPDRAHAVVWRNWLLVPVDDLAKLLGTTPANVTEMAQAMGLPPAGKVDPTFRNRGYITLVRRNWHLLPYQQLLQLLDISSEELAFRLREDDFLFVKLGNLKPRCEPVRYQPPDEQTKQRRAWMREVVQRYFGDQLGEGGEPRFAFVERLSRPQFDHPPEIPANQSVGLRYIYSYFGSFGDPLIDPSLDPYPDGLLERLAEMGVNGVWLHVVLRNLAPGGPDFPEFGKGCETRLANLNKLVERARRYGIGVYLYINEPRAMPREFFRDRPELAGTAEGDYVALCTSQPKVREWLSRALTHVFTEVPHLAGVFTITASENFTSCASHGRHQDCPRCRNRSADEIIAEVNATVEKGVHAANPDARVIAWDWGWHGHGDASSLIRLLPKSVWLMSVSEWAQPFQRGGVSGRVGEYSISVVGPGPRATQHWAVARQCGLKTAAKVQFNNTWEMSAVPFLPVLDLVAEHCSRLAHLDIDGTMLSWSLGGYPSPNLAAAYRFATDKEATVNSVLDAIAAQRYGAKAVPAARQAWTAFSTAFQEFPYDGQVLYNAPQQYGPSNLLYAEPTGYHSTMVGFPYDDLDGWRGPYPRQVFADQFAKVAEGWEQGLKAFADVIEKSDQNKRATAEADFGLAVAVQLHFASVANQARFVMARDAYRKADTPQKRHEAAQAIQAILQRERDVARRLYAVSKADSRIGFEASNQYYYVPLDMVEKVINCEFLAERFAP